MKLGKLIKWWIDLHEGNASVKFAHYGDSWGVELEAPADLNDPNMATVMVTDGGCFDSYGEDDEQLPDFEVDAGEALWDAVRHARGEGFAADAIAHLSQEEQG